MEVNEPIYYEGLVLPMELSVKDKVDMMDKRHETIENSTNRYKQNGISIDSTKAKYEKLHEDVEWNIDEY